jgi:PAS domain S-box-containing protein
MDADFVVEHGVHTSRPEPHFWPAAHQAEVSSPAVAWLQAPLRQHVLQIGVVFLAYFVAGTLGQATANIRSGNLGPVWPAFGIAVTAFLACGPRIWPGIVASAFLVALQSPVPAVAAVGQAAGATVAAAAAAFLLRRMPRFDPTLPRLQNALALIFIGAFGSAIVSASVGTLSLYATGLQPYSGIASAWLIYWLGDATGVLLVTPLVFTLPLLAVRSRSRVVEFGALLATVTGMCLLVFADLPVFPIRLHVLAFAVLPLVMWAAIRFGVGGAAVSVFLTATIATLLTAFGFGPFTAHSAFTNAALLDVLFAVLSVSGLVLAAVITEQEQGKSERERLIRAQAGMETRLRLAAIVESSHDAIMSTTLEGTILSWNAAAHRIFGFSEAEAIGHPTAILVPPDRRAEEAKLLKRLREGVSIPTFETIRVTKDGEPRNVLATISPLRGVDGRVVGTARILHDITEQRRAEEALSGVSRRLIETQERERSRIARELHDDIGQRLTLLAVSAAALAQTDSRFEAHARELQRQASDISAAVQALSHRLHSSRLELLGVTAAMRQFCTEFAARGNTTVKFEEHALPADLPPDISLSLFRILQEALHNSVKHSGAHQFDVRLWGQEDQVHLEVIDHGKGFDVDAARKGLGIGLITMEERMKLVDGDLSIESQPLHGTVIHARVRLGSSATSLSSAVG